MNQKDPATSLENKLQKKPIRIFLHSLSTPEDLQQETRQLFSGMKYGVPEAVQTIGKQMAEHILAQNAFLDAYSQSPEIFLSAAAFGAVPSAAHTMTTVIGTHLKSKLVALQPFKIVRNGGFARTNYGALASVEREKAIRSRKISFEPGWAEKLSGQLVLIIDDLRSSGAHERALIEFFEKETQNTQLVFAYFIGFQDGISPAHEEQLNHAVIQKAEDLLPYFAAEPTAPLMNARMLKFILLMKGKRMQSFLNQIGSDQALRLYNAATSSDGYCLSARFRDGFKVLEEWLFAEKIIPKCASFDFRNGAQKKLVVYNIEETNKDTFIDSASKENITARIADYSRFKYGDVNEIRFFAKLVAKRMIAALEAGGSLLETFEAAKASKEFVTITAPGVRNVVSASNFLMREAASIVNLWLTRRQLPTMLIRNLPRLGSGAANYATLSAKDRSNRQKTTQTIIPKSEYRTFPTHIIFVDDVEVTGQTVNRARTNSLVAGAKSFHSIFAFRVHPQQAKQDAGIEARLNLFVVTGDLDTGLAKILAHPDYHPVQRMLRLLLHSRNRKKLASFAEKNIPDTVLLRIYLGAMNNDFLWILSEEENEMGEYGPSLKIIEGILQKRQVIDADGIPV